MATLQENAQTIRQAAAALNAAMAEITTQGVKLDVEVRPGLTPKVRIKAFQQVGQTAE